MKRLAGFAGFARSTARAVGQPISFSLAVLAIVVWAALGYFADFSDTWQLIINTGTTIVTFLVVFLIQNTQNRDSKALQAKLDELIKSSRRADDALLGADELDDAELDRMCNHYLALAERRHRGSGASGDASALRDDDP